MEIKGKIHCLFEQSGTFKNEFKKLGYDAYDYDIQDNFNETDYVADLFKNIEDAYDGYPSLFDNFTKDDLIVAFFPCIYFCAMSQVAFNWGYTNYKNLSYKEKTDEILKRSVNREKFFSLLVKLCAISMDRGLRLIVENPWSEQTYLKANFVTKPTFVDNDRTVRGDFFKKPTAYWFFNCNPASGLTIQNDKKRKTIMSSNGSGKAGLCSEERSMISPDYARNFIFDFIIGKKQNIGQLQLF